MQKLRSVIFMAGLLLFILAAAMIYLSIKNIAVMPSSYEDKGTYIFIPYQVLPVQVKNTSASGRSRRMNPTKTVYMVYYKDNRGLGYKWTERAATREKGQKIVAAGVSVERRILSIPERGTYITVEPEHTAESYIEGLQKKYRIAFGVSASYVLFYVLAWCVVWKQRK